MEVRDPTGPHLRLVRGSICRSAIGRVSKTGQDVVIGPGCRKVRNEGHNETYLIFLIILDTSK